MEALQVLVETAPSVKQSVKPEPERKSEKLINKHVDAAEINDLCLRLV